MAGSGLSACVIYEIETSARMISGVPPLNVEDRGFGLRGGGAEEHDACSAGQSPS